jgi:hypothetical protein
MLVVKMSMSRDDAFSGLWNALSILMGSTIFSISFFVTVLVLISTRLLTGFKLYRQFDDNGGKTGHPPPMLPYWVPGFAHIIPFVMNQDKLMRNAR